MHVYVLTVIFGGVCILSADQHDLISTGNLLMRHEEAPPPLKRRARGPPQEGSFHFASRFTEERTIIAKSDNDV